MRALVRAPEKAAELASQGVSLIQGDLHNPEALHQLVEGSFAVIHAAGAVRGSSRSAFDHINVAGTATLIAAIKAQPLPPSLLLLSSLAAREPQLSWYAGSKRAAEEILEQEHSLDWVILRPPAVYGPGDKEMLPVFLMMARGIALAPGSSAARLSLIHVSDLVVAILACLDSADTRHQTLSLDDGKVDGYDWHELAEIAGATWGRRVRVYQAPSWLLDTVARFNLTLARIAGRAPMLTPPKLRELRHGNWVVDNQAITAATGWMPTVGLRDGLEQIGKAEL